MDTCRFHGYTALKAASRIHGFKSRLLMDTASHGYTKSDHPEVFLSRCPAHRLRVEHVEDAMPQSVEDNQSSVCFSLGPSASQLTATPPATATIATQCSGRSINAAMKDDPSNLGLGGFCTIATFLEAASKRPELSQKAAKGVPRGRSTRRSNRKYTTKSTSKLTNKSTTKSTTKNTTKSATKSATKSKSPAAPGASLNRSRPPPIYDSDSDSDFVTDSPPCKLVCRGDSDWDSDIVSDPESHPHPNRNSTSTADDDDMMKVMTLTLSMPGRQVWTSL